MSTSSNVWYLDEGLYVKAEVTQHTIDGDATKCKTCQHDALSIVCPCPCPSFAVARC
eukprot:SAG22_NODE_715_length_7716_cov_9.535513_4_plen_57_part_00